MKVLKLNMKPSGISTLLLLFAFTVTSEFNSIAQRKCESCLRHGLLIEFLNPHNPDYEDRLHEWNDCMKQYLGDREFLWVSDDPDLNAALEKCNYLDPPDKWYCYPSIMSVFMGERFTNPCFYFLSPIFYNPETDKPPEYIFKGSYEANLEGGRIIEYTEDYKKPVIARMELRLYYNGNTPELVTQWSLENTINDPRALFNKLKTPKSLNPVFEEFERKPIRCDAKIPTPDEICENDTCEIILSGFEDAKGNSSREFNRIVVHISLGTILNGEDCNFGPDRKVFNIGDGTVRVTYKPPIDKEDGFEVLKVYNSCDILPPDKYPYENTLPDELVADEKFPIVCTFDAILKTTGSYKKTERSSFEEDNGWGVSESTHNLDESREAVFYVPLQLENSFDVEALNLRYEYYRPLDINLSSFNAMLRSKDYRSAIGSDQGSRTTVLKNKIAADQKLSIKEILLQTHIVMTSDLTTGKVIKMDLDGFPVEFTWKETVDTHTESWWKPPPPPGHETIDKTETDTEEDTFCACPVEDPIPDPTIKSSTESIKKYLKDIGVALPENAELYEEEEIPIIKPDLLVKFGDGTTFFGGDGRKVIDDSNGSSVRRKEMTFTWQVTRKKKPL